MLSRIVQDLYRGVMLDCPVQGHCVELNCTGSV